MLCGSGSRGSITPIQPRSFPCTSSVTNTPWLNEKEAGSDACQPSGLSSSALTIADRASANMARRSSAENCWSGRDDILGLRACFHHAQFSALRDTAVELAPEPEKILRRGNQSAGDHQPQQYVSERLQRSIARTGDKHGYRQYLQNHFCFSESRSGNGEAFGGSDVAQTEHRKFESDDNHYHPRGNQMHIHQRDEGCGNQQLVGDGIEQD